MALSDEDVREILRIIDESGVDELRIESEGLSLHVRRGAGAETAPPEPPARPARPAPPAPPAPHAAVSADTPPVAADDRQDDGRLTIDSPMLGTFYRAESPGQDPFIEVGSAVEPGTTVCIIEVMKMMNSVSAGVSGTVVEICPQNSELVEYGQPLFRVAPAS
jgi:acetyl-CoA carboxylase biotin carboxyl carrier protein